KYLNSQSKLIGSHSAPFDVKAFGQQVSIDQQRNAREAWDQLFEQLQAFRCKLFTKIRQSSHIPARPRKGLDQLHTHRVGNGHEYDWDFCGGIPQKGCPGGGHHQDIDIEGDEFGRHGPEALGLLVGETVFEDDVATVDVAELGEAFDYGFDIRRFLFTASRMPEKADTRNPSALLRARRERPRRRAAEQRDEFASPHSITSSARASSDGGTVRPSTLAAWALMTSSNFVDCTTGRSAGFVPLRMRPV